MAITQGDIIVFSSVSPSDLLIGKVLCFQDSHVGGSHTSAVVECLYWPDEVRQCLRQSDKEMPEHRENEVFFTTHQDTIDIQRIAELVDVEVVGVASNDIEKIPSNQLLARWRFNLSKKEFVPLVSEEKENESEPAAILRRSSCRAKRGWAEHQRQSGMEVPSQAEYKPVHKPHPHNMLSPRISLFRSPKACTSTIQQRGHVEQFAGRVPPSGRSLSRRKGLTGERGLSPCSPCQPVESEVKNDVSAHKRRLTFDPSDILSIVCDEDDRMSVSDDGTCAITDSGAIAESVLPNERNKGGKKDVKCLKEEAPKEIKR